MNTQIVESLPNPTEQTVVVAIYEYRNGTGIRVFHHRADAEDWRQEIAEQRWAERVTRQPKPKPFDEAAADLYFECAQENDEYFAAHQLALE